LAGSKVDLLRRSRIFAVLSDDDLAALVGLAVSRRFGAGEFVFWEGDEPRWFYMVAEGGVKIIKHSSQGREFIVAFFGPGEMFGEVAVFEGKAYPASARTTAPTELLGVEREAFMQFLSVRPQVALRIITVLGGRLREAQTRLRDLAGERVEQRITRLLVRLSARLGQTLPFTRQDIADMTGTTTETAIRIMSELGRRGIIRSVRGRVTIVNAEKLRLLAEGHPRV